MATNEIYFLTCLAVLAWVILICIVIRRPNRRLSAPRPRHFYHNSFTAKKRRVLEEGARTSEEKGRAPDLLDPGQQLRSVISAPFEKKRLLNSSEYKIFKIVEDDVVISGSGYRVFAQTNLGEILSSPDEDGFRSINSKRVDMLIVDRGGWPIVAIEYQGKGHYRGMAAARDAVKREALRKAGVRYIEVSDDDGPEHIRVRIREQLRQSRAATGSGMTLEAAGRAEQRPMPR